MLVARALNTTVFSTLNANMGSMFINQFNVFGRIWQVNIQAEGDFRTTVNNLNLLQVRNRQGQPVPLAALEVGHGQRPVEGCVERDGDDHRIR
jgi:multidrug efflux pump subunit AcrB